jgi:GntR family transcriptional regulator
LYTCPYKYRNTAFGAKSSMYNQLGGTAKHTQISRVLMEEIAAGRYAVGGMLPSEPALSAQFGASRQTVRAALKNLRDLGLIEARHGVGSFVRAAQPTARYAYSFDSAVDLLQYATGTQVEVRSCDEITLNAGQAAALGRGQGERWWQVQTVRSSREDGQRIASSCILVPYAYGSVLRELNETNEPIFALIQRKLDQAVTEIWQEISATEVSAEDASLLGVPAGQPALSIERRYFGRGGELFEVSRSVHPAGTFSYSMRVRLGVANGHAV